MPPVRGADDGRLEGRGRRRSRRSPRARPDAGTGTRSRSRQRGAGLPTQPLSPLPQRGAHCQSSLTLRAPGPSLAQRGSICVDRILASCRTKPVDSITPLRARSAARARRPGPDAHRTRHRATERRAGPGLRHRVRAPRANEPGRGAQRLRRLPPGPNSYPATLTPGEIPTGDRPRTASLHPLAHPRAMRGANEPPGLGDSRSAVTTSRPGPFFMAPLAHSSAGPSGHRFGRPVPSRLRPMPNDDIDVLRRRTEQAYARWRACAALRTQSSAADASCTRLKAELDLAARMLFLARRPSLAHVPAIAPVPAETTPTSE